QNAASRTSDENCSAEPLPEKPVTWQPRGSGTATEPEDDVSASPCWHGGFQMLHTSLTGRKLAARRWEEEQKETREGPDQTIQSPEGGETPLPPPPVSAGKMK
ncbi:hypothetical protein AMECASPLE_037098, partial [Ameca splendens]